MTGTGWLIIAAFVIWAVIGITALVADQRRWSLDRMRCPMDRGDFVFCCLCGTVIGAPALLIFFRGKFDGFWSKPMFKKDLHHDHTS